MYHSNTVCSFFFNDTATTEIYTLSLHDALPIFLIQPEPLVLVEELLQEEVLVANAVQVAVDQVVLAELHAPVALLGRLVVVVRGRGAVGGQKRLVPVLP